MIEGSVHKQRAQIVIRNVVKFIPNGRTPWKDVVARLGTSAFHWFHLNPEGDVEIASWAVHKYMVRICYKFNDDSEKGDESCYLDFWINLRLKVSYIKLYSIVLFYC